MALERTRIFSTLLRPVIYSELQVASFITMISTECNIWWFCSCWSPRFWQNLMIKNITLDVTKWYRISNIFILNRKGILLANISSITIFMMLIKTKTKDQLALSSLFRCHLSLYIPSLWISLWDYSMYLLKAFYNWLRFMTVTIRYSWSLTNLRNIYCWYQAI